MQFEEFKLVTATLDDYPILQNMARFYVYDMSEYFPDDSDFAMPANGLCECIDFKHYWQNMNAYPFFIRRENELVGFVIIDDEGTNSEVKYNMAQFFINRKFKGRGIGNYIATHCFDKFRGTWEVMVMQGNTGAYQFWKKIISRYTKNIFTETRCTIETLEYPDQIVFRFNSAKH